MFALGYFFKIAICTKVSHYVWQPLYPAGRV